MDSLFETLTWLGFFTAIFLSLYFFWQFRNRERMALIEKGVDISEIYKKRQNNFKFPWISISLLIVGIGGGIIMAVFFLSDPPFDIRNDIDDEGFVISSFLLLFGGAGLFLGHLIEKTINIFGRTLRDKNG